MPVYFAGVRGNAVLLAQKFLGEILSDGSVAVDATAGNGHDTLFLAQAVGGAGQVYAFDIQPQALENTATLLKQKGLGPRVELICAGHQELEQYLEGPVDGFIFNLGYLPGGDHHKTTKPTTTVQAVQSALKYIRPGGRISIVVYTGHPGADAESQAVEDLAAQLDPAFYGVLKVSLFNRPASAPFLILIERVKK